MVQSPCNCFILSLTQPQVANQQQQKTNTFVRLIFCAFFLRLHLLCKFCAFVVIARANFIWLGSGFELQLFFQLLCILTSFQALVHPKAGKNTFLSIFCFKCKKGELREQLVKLQLKVQSIFFFFFFFLMLVLLRRTPFSGHLLSPIYKSSFKNHRKRLSIHLQISLKFN